METYTQSDNFIFAAQAELELRRRRLRNKLEGSFKEFITYFFPIVENADFIFKEHHDRIIDKLTGVYDGSITRLVVNIPPGYGKTELVVVLFCAWCYAKTKDCRFLHLSYSSDLTAANSIKIKAILETKEFQDLWGMKFSKELNGKEAWATDESGEFRAKSTGGAVTGFRAGRLRNTFSGALIIDDPIKPEDAESDILRNKMNSRLNNTLKSRLMHENVPVILIMQRVHENDPAGFMLSGKTGDNFELLRIEAITRDEDGNEIALWSEKDSLEYLQAYRLAAPFEFSSQYQQNPIPDDGIYFKREDFQWYNDLPEGEDFGSSDYASTKGGGDFTEHGVFRITPDGRVYAKDWWSEQASADEWIESQLDLAIRHGVKMWGGETGPIRNSTEPFLKRRMLERKHLMGLHWFSHAEASKESNARGFQAIVSAHRFYLPMNQQWAHDLVDQLCRFPRGKFDDKVDVCSLFAKMFNKVWAHDKIEKTNNLPLPNTIDAIIREHRKRKGNGSRL